MGVLDSLFISRQGFGYRNRFEPGVREFEFPGHDKRIKQKHIF
jgi:hypothetical protein